MKTIFDIKIDFEKSKGSYVFDKNTNAYYLDFFNMYSTIPLGYNHPVFNKDFEKEVCDVCKFKMCNNVFQSEKIERFLTKFGKYCFSGNIHLTCTGSLAVESAIKCALNHKKSKNPRIIALKRGFHGLNGYGLLTDDYLDTRPRLEYLPRIDGWRNMELDNILELLDTGYENGFPSSLLNIAAIIIDPIQCAAGDIYLDKTKLQKLQKLCNKNDVCFIVDEVQTGFGATEKFWYSDVVGIKPDILVFGKKSQVSGIIASDKYNECFISTHQKLEVTFDGELIDIIRATYILEFYEKIKPINNKHFIKIKKILDGKVKNIRGSGHLIAFDFDGRERRDDFFNKCLENKLLVNKGGGFSIRLRPNLALTNKEINDFKKIFNKIITK